MSHRVFTIEFSDGLRLYGIEDGVCGYKYRQLFASSEAAWDRRCSGLFDHQEPTNSKATQETVIYDPDESWAFHTRASRSGLWLTGPRDSDECEADQPADFSMYGAKNGELF